ncbi:sialidase family protein [Larkinella insperata]|uniref:Sialidase family protein n=1 Tax=Larkinella insperata TaxID=332158 RepID=A0ABW3Q4T0_9BACT|nr:sialidase family protein [Larkinella insperata]
MNSTHRFRFWGSLLLLIGASYWHSSCAQALKAASQKPNASQHSTGRNDAWRYVGPGGGGAMFNPTVSPHKTDQVLVSCDMTGAYITHNAGEQWRMFNLRMPVQFFTFDPQNPDVIYANSLALYRSTDGGTTWNVVYPNPADIRGVVAQGDHASEVLVTTDSTRRTVLALAIDPANSRKLYAAIRIDQTVGFFQSTNWGQTWTKERELPEAAKNIYIDPTSPANARTVYVTTKNAIYVKKGAAWTVNKGPEGVQNLTAFAGGFDPKQKKIILYATAGKSYFNAKGDPSGIFFTDDGGAHWENRQTGLVARNVPGAELPEWRGIGTSAGHPNVVYVSYVGIKTHPDSLFFGVARSDDFGKSWKLVWKDLDGKGQSVATPNIKEGWINERFGAGWAGNPFNLGVAPTNPDICYGTDFGRTVKTVDGGRTWEQVYTKKGGDGWVSRGLEVTTAYSFVTNPFDPKHQFITYTDIGLMESRDGGATWNSATRNGVPKEWVNTTYALVFDPKVKARAWAVMSGTHDLPRPKMFRRTSPKTYQGGILVTDDAGTTWQVVSQEIGEAGMTSLVLDPGSNPAARTLYACAFGKGVYKSTDGGKSWQLKNNGISGEEPFAWKLVRRPTDGALFLLVARRNDDGTIGTPGNGALYRSDNGAESWTKLGLPIETNSPVDLAVDPQDPERLVLTAWGRKTAGKLTPDIGGGIFLSTNSGKTWKPVFQKDQHVHDVTIDSRNGVYYACGFNSAAYRSEDRGLTWARIKGYNFKWGQRVEPDPQNPENVYIITFGGGVWHGPARGDKKAVEDIVTPVVAY